MYPKQLERRRRKERKLVGRVLNLMICHLMVEKTILFWFVVKNTPQKKHASSVHKVSCRRTGSVQEEIPDKYV
jgi:hypothetical protein